MSKQKCDITELFEYTLPHDSTLFRGLYGVSEYNKSHNEISWFTFDKNKASTYAKNNGIVCTFKPLKQPIKLVHITSMFFRMHFIDQINLRYIKNADTKIPIFSAIGFPSLDLVQYVINKHLQYKPANSCSGNSSEASEIKLFAEYLGGHRLSESTIDKLFADAMEIVYGDRFDGYISIMNWHTCHHNTFPPEVCLFKPKQVLRLMDQVSCKPKSRIAKGGTVQEDWVPPWDSHALQPEINIHEYNKMVEADLTERGWTKPLKYDEDGKIIWPNNDEVIQCTLDGLFERDDNDATEKNTIPEQTAGKILATTKTKTRSVAKSSKTRKHDKP